MLQDLCAEDLATISEMGVRVYTTTVDPDGIERELDLAEDGEWFGNWGNKPQKDVDLYDLFI
jgi:hypothetical protein